MNSFAFLLETEFLLKVMISVLGAYTLYTVLVPFFAKSDLSKRMRVTALEREEIRARERRKMGERLKDKDIKSLFDDEPVNFKYNIVKKFNLSRFFAVEEIKVILLSAGIRGKKHITSYIFFSVVSPIIAAVATFLAITVLQIFDEKMLFNVNLIGMFLMIITVLTSAKRERAMLILLPIVVIDITAFFTGAENMRNLQAVAFSVVMATVAFFAPLAVIKSKAEKRKKSIQRAWPDAMDLLLICVESGMSVEAAIAKVAEEMTSQSPDLSEELKVTSAELAYLNERRQAFENLGKRSDLSDVKAVMTAMIQSDRYGTPMGATLRVLAQENRDMRRLRAEKKAAALPPKLSGMVVFMLPALFIVILGPSIIQVMGLK